MISITELNALTTLRNKSWKKIRHILKQPDSLNSMDPKFEQRNYPYTNALTDGARVYVCTPYFLIRMTPKDTRCLREQLDNKKISAIRYKDRNGEYGINDPYHMIDEINRFVGKAMDWCFDREKSYRSDWLRPAEVYDFVKECKQMSKIASYIELAPPADTKHVYISPVYLEMVLKGLCATKYRIMVAANADKSFDNGLVFLQTGDLEQKKIAMIAPISMDADKRNPEIEKGMTIAVN